MSLNNLENAVAFTRWSSKDTAKFLAAQNRWLVTEPSKLPEGWFVKIDWSMSHKPRHTSQQWRYRKISIIHWRKNIGQFPINTLVCAWALVKDRVAHLYHSSFLKSWSDASVFRGDTQSLLWSEQETLTGSPLSKCKWSKSPMASSAQRFIKKFLVYVPPPKTAAEYMQRGIYMLSSKWVAHDHSCGGVRWSKYLTVSPSGSRSSKFFWGASWGRSQRAW